MADAGRQPDAPYGDMEWSSWRDTITNMQLWTIWLLQLAPVDSDSQLGELAVMLCMHQAYHIITRPASGGFFLILSVCVCVMSVFI